MTTGCPPQKHHVVKTEEYENVETPENPAVRAAGFWLGNLREKVTI
jgi:hypothetical protein